MDESGWAFFPSPVRYRFRSLLVNVDLPEYGAPATKVTAYPLAHSSI